MIFTTPNASRHAPSAAVPFSATSIQRLAGRRSAVITVWATHRDLFDEEFISCVGKVRGRLESENGELVLRLLNAADGGGPTLDDECVNKFPGFAAGGVFRGPPSPDTENVEFRVTPGDRINIEMPGTARGDLANAIAGREIQRRLVEAERLRWMRIFEVVCQHAYYLDHLVMLAKGHIERCGPGAQVHVGRLRDIKSGIESGVADLRREISEITGLSKKPTPPVGGAPA